MDNKYYWLIMSAEKDDAQIIDTDSEMWGYLSQSDKLKKTEGKEARLFKGNDWRTYKILKHGTDDYTADLRELRKQLKLDDPVSLSDSTQAGNEESDDLVDPQSSKVRKLTMVSVCFISKAYNKKKHYIQYFVFLHFSAVRNIKVLPKFS